MLCGAAIKKWLIRIAITLVLVLALLLFDIFGGFAIIQYALQNEGQDNLSFSYSSCDEDLGYGPSRTLRQEWVGEQLIIEGVVHPNCGTNWMFGSYTQEGDKLTLNYKSTIAYFLACACTKKVTYKISDIPVRDYTVSFNEEEPLVYSPVVNYFIFGEDAQFY
jgi:hypothetical protein